MATRVVSTAEDLKKYDEWIKHHLHGNLWQSLEWKTYQESLGREVRIYVVEDSSKPSPYPSPLKGRGEIVTSALIVIDRTTFGLSTWDIPRGPLWENSNSHFLETIIKDATTDKCMSLYVSPPTPLVTTHYKLQTSHRHEQPEATRIIDLTQSDEDILTQMKPKGRYNIRIAQKHGIEVQESRDIDAFYALLLETGNRDRFKTLPKKHYTAFLGNLPGSFLLLAFIPTQKKPIGGLMGVVWHQQGIYYYGASNYTYRALMAPYLLQWEAIRYCGVRGCITYDLLGVLASDPLTLPHTPWERENLHPWTGVSRFKEQFGGTVIEYPPEQEIVLKPLIKKLLTVKRRFLS